ncbi:cytidylyltransferase domain-containing protein [Syntrophomonas palmitatica]|uniref:cytidylyltransferase domain-containing protein n=1 Tax=Syntrophomonas palmitatica TaxID=402877 RepID=UPI0006D10546|nr:glycosyltransferase family protein [Syntrophomonas palmitatica]
MSIGCIIEARMTSTRLPEKVLLDIVGKPSILRQIERVNRSRYIDLVVVATTVNPEDDPLVGVLEKNNIQFFRGSEDDVLGRVAATAQAFNIDTVVEITGDCPLVDIKESDRVIERYLEGSYDLVSNNLLRSYPLGMDTIVMDNRVLQESARLTDDPVHREHVCMYLYEHPFDYRFSNVEAPRFLYDPKLRMTLDTREDYEFISRIYEELYPQKPDFDLYDMMRLLQKLPELRKINEAIHHKKVR